MLGGLHCCSPEQIQSKFGGGLSSWVLDDEGKIQPHRFTSQVICHAAVAVSLPLGMLGIAGGPCWPSAGLCLDLEPGIDVVFKKPLLSTWNIPDLSKKRPKGLSIENEGQSDH